MVEHQTEADVVATRFWDRQIVWPRSKFKAPKRAKCEVVNGNRYYRFADGSLLLRDRDGDLLVC